MCIKVLNETLRYNFLLRTISRRAIVFEIFGFERKIVVPFFSLKLSLKDVKMGIKLSLEAILYRSSFETFKLTRVERQFFMKGNV